MFFARRPFHNRRPKLRGAKLHFGQVGRKWGKLELQGGAKSSHQMGPRRTIELNRLLARLKAAPQPSGGGQFWRRLYRFLTRRKSQSLMNTKT